MPRTILSRTRSAQPRRSDRVAVGRNLFGLSAQAKAKLIEKLSSSAAARVIAPTNDRTGQPGGDAARLDVTELEAYREIRIIEETAEYLAISDPFFRVH